MRVLSVTAQKPCSTGSGVYLTEVVRSLAKMGVSQAVVAGVTREDRVDNGISGIFFVRKASVSGSRNVG